MRTPYLRDYVCISALLGMNVLAWGGLYLLNRSGELQRKEARALTDSLINKKGVLKGIGVDSIKPLVCDTIQLKNGMKAIINRDAAEVVLKLAR